MAGSATEEITREITGPGDHKGMSQGYLSRLRNVYQHGGLKGVVVRAVRKIRSLLWRSNEAWWFERDLTRPIKRAQLLPTASVDIDTGEEAWHWIRDSLRGGFLGKVEREECRIGTRNGHLVALIKHEGEYVGYVKVGLGQVFVADFMSVLTLPNDTAFIYDSYIDPDLRGKGLAPAATEKLMSALRQRGYCRLLCHIAEWNQAAQNYVLKCGFVKKKRIRFRSVCGWKSLSENPFEV